MFQPFIAFNPFMDRARAHELLPNQEYSFLNSLLHYVWYNWNLVFFKRCLTGPPSHRQNSNFWQSFCLWILASFPIFQLGTSGKELSLKTLENHKSLNRKPCLPSTSEIKNHRIRLTMKTKRSHQTAKLISVW